MKNKEYIEKWLAGELTEAEMQEFEQTQDFAEIKKLDEHLQYFRSPSYKIEEEYVRLKQQLSNKENVVHVNWWKPVLKVAAAVLVLAVAFSLFLILPKTKLESSIAQKVEHFLPDSSKVILNAESAISYRSFQWNRNRELYLKGEAFFDVASGSKFEVNTTQGLVTVLGTEFNVVSRDDFFEVVCYEGKVRVLHNDQKNILTAGNGLRVWNGKITKHSNALASKPGWINNESKFVSMPYGYVIEEFERQYGRTIVEGPIDKSILFTGAFVHDDFILALKSITQPLNLKYQIAADEIILSRDE